MHGSSSLDVGWSAVQPSDETRPVCVTIKYTGCATCVSHSSDRQHSTARKLGVEVRIARDQMHYKLNRAALTTTDTMTLKQARWACMPRRPLVLSDALVAT
jgi:hypothetical protein